MHGKNAAAVCVPRQVITCDESVFSEVSVRGMKNGREDTFEGFDTQDPAIAESVMETVNVDVNKWNMD